jgi:hypothetical protein
MIAAKKSEAPLAGGAVAKHNSLEIKILLEREKERKAICPSSRSAAATCTVDPREIFLGRGAAAAAAATEQRHEERIAHCTQVWMAAYRRFQSSGDPAERAYAVLWAQRQAAAILARSPEAQARRHAEFEDLLDQVAESAAESHAHRAKVS